MKKRILKRIGCSVIILSSLLLGTACLNPSNAQDVLFYKSTEHVGMGYISEHDGTIYHFGFNSPVIFDFENEKYLLERDYQDILHLKSADGTTDYLSFVPSFIPSDDEFFPTFSTSYYVKKIYTSNPNLQFLEIVMLADPNGQTEGYWLIGKHNNNWITYVSYDSLKSMGLSDGGTVRSTVNSDLDGEMILNLNAYDPDPIQIKLYWNNTADRIEMNRL
ncbi:MAG: hypothetical protein SOY74_05720 [Allisonella histaminiformans]|uniref:hypothetical protein n=1 Tax=Allisonella histaminiformans TaxID=209880 RepID=UPI002A8065E7|nr:hypothetical protein [Allisonella histaminiformans]MDY3957670.1 hypothetical protein [Allisonella histaminiformans]